MKKKMGQIKGKNKEGRLPQKQEVISLLGNTISEEMKRLLKGQLLQAANSMRDIRLPLLLRLWKG